MAQAKKANPLSASLSSYSSSSLTSFQQTKWALPSQTDRSSSGSRSSKILKNRTTERIQSEEQRTPRITGFANSIVECLPIAGRNADLNEDIYTKQLQPWESPTYKLGVPLNEFRPTHSFFYGCDGSDDAINSSMSVASEYSLNTTSSSLEEHVLQLLENYQSDGNGSVRSACENPVARTLMSDSAFSDVPLDDISVSYSISSPRRHSSPTAVGSGPPESTSHRPAALHASASAPILHFSPYPR